MIRNTFCVFVWSVCLSGCVAPEGVKVSPEVSAQVKAAVLSPEIASVLSSHVEQVATKAVNKAVSQQGLVNIEKVKAEVKTGIATQETEQTGKVNIYAPGGAWILGGLCLVQLIAIVYLIVHERGWRKEDRILRESGT